MIALGTEKISERMLVPRCPMVDARKECLRRILSSTEMNKTELSINLLNDWTTPVQYVHEQSFASFGWISPVGGVDGKSNFVLAKRYYRASDKRQNLPSIIALA